MGVPNELNAAYGGGSGSGPPLPVPLRSTAGRYLNHSLIGAGPYLDLKPIVPSQFTAHSFKKSVNLAAAAADIAEVAALPLASSFTSDAFVPSSTALSLCEASTPTPSSLSLVGSHPDDILHSFNLFLDFRHDDLLVKNSEIDKSDLDDFSEKSLFSRKGVGSRPCAPYGSLSLDIAPTGKSAPTEFHRISRSRSNTPSSSSIRNQTRFQHLSRLQGFTSEELRNPRLVLHPRPSTGPRTRNQSPSPIGSRTVSSVSSLFPRFLGSLVCHPHLLEGTTTSRPLPQPPCPVHEREKLRPLRQEEILPSGRLRRTENTRGSWVHLPNVAEEVSTSGADAGTSEDSCATITSSSFSEASPKRSNSLSSSSEASPKTRSGSPKKRSPDRESPPSASFGSARGSFDWESLSKPIVSSNDSWGPGVGLRFQELENEAQREEQLRKTLEWNKSSHLGTSVSNRLKPSQPEDHVQMSHSRSEGNYSSKKMKSSMVFEQKVRRLEKLLQGTYYEGAVIRPDPEMLYFTSSEETMDSSMDSDSSVSEASNHRRKTLPSMGNTEWVMPALTQPSPLDMRWTRHAPIDTLSSDFGGVLCGPSFDKEESAPRPTSRAAPSLDSDHTWDLREVEEAKELLQRLHNWLSSNLQQHQLTHPQVSGKSSNASQSWDSSLFREAVNFVQHKERASSASSYASAESVPAPSTPQQGLRMAERPRTPGGDEAPALSESEEVRPCTPSGDEARPLSRPLPLRAPVIRSHSPSAKDSVWPTSASPMREPEAEKMVEDRIALTKARMAALGVSDDEDDDDDDEEEGENKEERDEERRPEGWDPSASLWAGVARARQVASTAAGHLKSSFRVMQDVFAKCFFPSRLMEARREGRRNKPRHLTPGGSCNPGSTRSSPRSSSDSDGGAPSLQGEQDAAAHAGGAANASGAGGGGGNPNPLVPAEQPPGQPSSPICRICHSGPHSVPGLGPLLAPCRCRGTVALIHKSCLEHWLTEVGSNHCELCGFRFRTTYEPHMSLAYAVLLWIKSGLDIRQMIQDLVWLSVMTPMAGMAAYTALNTARLLAVGPRAAQASAPWLLAGLFVSCSITLVAYYGWVLGAVHHYTNVWRSWWRRNFSVRVLFDPDESLPRVELPNGGGGGTVADSGGGVVTGTNVALEPPESPGSELLLKVHANVE